MNALRRFLACGALCLMAALAQAQDGHGVDTRQGLGTQRHHPSQDQPLHETFYSKWHMPDNPSTSCCNEADCYPTEIKFADGNIYAKRRVDGKYILVPAQKVERNSDNPDGRNHLCAPPPSASYPSDTVYCFALGGST
jgi:hypothetical protein